MQDSASVEELARLLFSRGMGSISLWNLRQAVLAADADGVDAQLFIRIPARPKDHLEAMVSIGAPEVNLRWSWA